MTISGGNIALVYYSLGERDEAPAWLELAHEQRDLKMVLLKVDPKWIKLRADPRLQDLLWRVGFPQ